jgi:hypothetical protein
VHEDDDDCLHIFKVIKEVNLLLEKEQLTAMTLSTTITGTHHRLEQSQQESPSSPFCHESKGLCTTIVELAILDEPSDVRDNESRQNNLTLMLIVSPFFKLNKLHIRYCQFTLPKFGAVSEPC